jgi:hypothetical protein
MKPTKFLCLCSLILAGPVFGEEARPPRTDINPALLYYQSFLLAPEISKDDRSYLFESQEWSRGQKLPERFGELVGYYGKQLRYARQAAHCTVPCDWGIDMGPGPNTLLPHLAKCKGIAQAGRLRAMWALQQGRPADARDDLIACMALGRNSSRDGTLIGALVQIAIENIVCSTVAENYFQLSPETLKELSEGIAAAPPRGNMAECIKMEKAFFLDWFIAKIEQLQKENPGDDPKVLAGIHEAITFMETPNEGETQPAPNKTWDQTLKAAGGTSQGILKLVTDMAALYERLAVIMALPQPEYENRIKDFAAEVESTKNPLVTMAFPAFEKCRTKEFFILAELAMVQAAVEYKLHGEAGLKSVRDPYGDGPFGFQRFYFQGVDRGFELKSAYEGRGYPTVLIFVEKDGAPFQVTGPKAGKAMAAASAAK